MRWDPLRDLRILQERMNRLADRGVTDWAPPVDIYETPHRYIVVAELAGVAREDVDIRFQENSLLLSGQRPIREVLSGRYHRIERGHGAFARRFEFPEPIDCDRVTAEFRGGLLTVTLAKQVPPEPHRIEVA